MKLNFQRNERALGKTPFFLEGQFCTPYSICLNISFWQSRFAWKCCVYNTFKEKTVLQFSKKIFSFPENLFQSSSNKNFQNPQKLSCKNMPISFEQKVILKIPSTGF